MAKILKIGDNVKNLIEITPKSFSCGPLGGCPAVYVIEGEDKLAIVGKKIKASKLGIAGRVGKDEEVITVDRDMIRQIFEK